MIRVFLDANVFFAGFFSERGASSFILELGRRRRLAVTSSRLVLREADRNLRNQAPAQALKNFHRYLQGTKIQVTPAPSAESLAVYEPCVHPKDLPVLAAAVESKAEFLITLGRKHFLTPLLLSKVKGISIITPSEFLREVYLKGKI